MADIAVENKEAPVVEKEVEENDAPKVVADEEEEEDVVVEKAVENGTATEEKSENGDADEKTVDEDKDEESTNGDSTDAPAEAVKRKVVADAPDTPSEDAATPEKKAKLDEATKEVEANGAETEVAA